MRLVLLSTRPVGIGRNLILLVCGALLSVGPCLGDLIPLGSEFQVNSSIAGWQLHPDVAVDDLGGFVVVWQTDVNTGDIRGQRLAADDSPVGGEFQVNVDITEAQVVPSVARHGLGDFLVTWASYGSAYGPDPDFRIRARLYSSDGTPQGGDLQVNTATQNGQYGHCSTAIAYSVNSATASPATTFTI